MRILLNKVNTRLPSRGFSKYRHRENKRACGSPPLAGWWLKGPFSDPTSEHKRVGSNFRIWLHIEFNTRNRAPNLLDRSLDFRLHR